MSIEINFPFTTPSNYTYDTNKIEISGGKAELKLEQDDIDFTEDFDNDTGHTYDSDKLEFTGGQVQQKDQRPSGATFFANFETDQDANWSDGDGSGTLAGSASVSGGFLDTTAGAGSYCSYDALGNADSEQTGCVRIQIRPNYSGSPTSNNAIVSINKGDGSVNNLIQIIHLSTGIMLFQIFSSSAGIIFSANLAAWSPIASTIYEIEINYDITTGASRLFIDGVQLGATQTGTGTRSASDINNIYIGTSYDLGIDSNFYTQDIVVFSTVQHTANYTPGETISPYEYVEASDVLPEMEHTGDGSMILFNALSVTYAGGPRVLIEIGRSGNKLYWNGSAWITSDETYDQATDPTTFNTNCGSLPINTFKYIQFTMVFQNSNSQSSVSELTANINADIGYYTDNPTILMNTAIRLEGLDSFTETATKTGSDEIKYILKKDSDWYYWDGAAWSISNGTYAQSSTASDIETNKASFTSSIVVTQIKLFLHSEDGSTKPEISNLKVSYDFAGEDPDTINTCIVWGYSLNNDGTADTSPIKIKLNKGIVQYKNYTMVSQEEKTITPDSLNGYFEIELVETANMVPFDGEIAQYIFNFDQKGQFERPVPNAPSQNIFDL